MGMDTSPVKAVSWDQLSLERRQALIRQAFDALYPRPMGEYEARDVSLWDVYDTSVTVRQYSTSKLWQVAYQVADDGTISFTPQADWVEVELLPIAVKGDFEMDVLYAPYGGPFNGKDLQGQWFDDATNYHEDKYGLPPIVYYHGFTPDGKPAGAPVYLGKALNRWVDKAGRWARVRIDDTLKLSGQVIEAAKKGLARASSGSVAHLARIAQSGHIDEWPVVEISIFDVGDNRRPVNPYAVAVPTAKALFVQAGLPLPSDIDPPAPSPTGAVAPAQSGAGSQAMDQPAAQDRSTHREVDMDPKEIQALIDKGIEDRLAAQAAAVKAEADKAAAIKAEVDKQVEAQTAAIKAELVKSRRLPDGMPHVAQFGEVSKFDNWSLEDMAFWGTFVPRAVKAGIERARPLPDTFLKALVIRALDDNGKTKPGEFAMKALASAYHRESGIPLVAVKANEVMQYDLADYGDDWVQTLYADGLWYKIRFGTPVLDKMAPYMREIMNAEEMKYLLEGADVVWYKVPEVASLPTTELTGVPNATIPTSRMGSANQSLTLAKMGARVLVSGELGVSTPISVVTEVRLQQEKTGRGLLENLLINGDTDATVTTNINDIGGTPTSTDSHLLLNGFRKLALIGGSGANSRACGATLSSESYTETALLMGTGGMNALPSPEQVSYIVDINTWSKTLKLPEFLTRDVAGENATLFTGRVPPIGGIGTILSDQMHRVIAGGAEVANVRKADSAGKVNQDSLGNNIYGAILAVRWDQWRMAYRRRMSFEAQRIANIDATELVALAETGLVYRDTEAAAITYGVPLS